MKIIFFGVKYRNGKGGVASVLMEYSNIFPDAIFVSTTVTSNIFLKLFYSLVSTIKCFYLPLLYPHAIYHIHGSSYNSFERKYIYFKILKFFNVKLIYHIHGAEFHIFYKNSSVRKRKKIQDFINNVDGLICLSSFWENFFTKNFRPKRVKVIPNIVPDPILISKTSNDKFQFLFLGHISERKGIWLLLEVIEELKNILNDKVVFKIGGNGEVEKLNQIIKKKEINKIAEYIGWVSNEEKIKFLSNSDAYILPSYNEGLPISILEAMSYGLPIVSTKVGGIPEIVKNNVNGFLIEPGNKVELKKALLNVVKDQNNFKNFGKESVRLVENYMPKNVKSELIDYYKLIL